jgi:hypothetical protein
MQLADESPPENTVSFDASASRNCAEVLLSSPWFSVLFPGVAYVLAVLVQTQLNHWVDMSYGSSILYLSFGVRLFVALVFGAQGLLWMVLGQLFIFAFYPTPYYDAHPVEGFLLTCWYSLVAFFSVELVRKIRHLDASFIRAKTLDILLITFFAATFSSISHFGVLGEFFAVPIYNVLMSFCAKFVGSMIGFYALMLFFSLLHGIPISRQD